MRVKLAIGLGAVWGGVIGLSSVVGVVAGLVIALLARGIPLFSAIGNPLLPRRLNPEQIDGADAAQHGDGRVAPVAGHPAEYGTQNPGDQLAQA